MTFDIPQRFSVLWDFSLKFRHIWLIDFGARSLCDQVVQMNQIKQVDPLSTPGAQSRQSA